ncbi:hypothetical protein O6P43_017881 [Quillaja saponaria]|uniref:Uncharacterized protein n=1 Tax=Quillaja saponaria TaxID=32244 RepID=A0AAD7LQV4_QUISA|nr:hypothetical protein O6P43_017881 [Quillaja saponaria]
MSSTGGNYTLTQCWQNVMHELFQMKSELKSKEMKLRRMPQNHMHASNNIHNHIFLLQQQQQQQQQLGRRGMINPNMYMIHQRRHRPLNQDQILPLPRTKLQVPAAGAGFNFDNNHALLPMNTTAAPTAGGTAFDNSGEQNLEGLINQNGKVSGTANGSIFILNNFQCHPVGHGGEWAWAWAWHGMSSSSGGGGGTTSWRSSMGDPWGSSSTPVVETYSTGGPTMMIGGGCMRSSTLLGGGDPFEEFSFPNHGTRGGGGGFNVGNHVTIPKSIPASTPSPRGTSKSKPKSKFPRAASAFNSNNSGQQDQDGEINTNGAVEGTGNQSIYNITVNDYPGKKK